VQGVRGTSASPDGGLGGFTPQKPGLSDELR
jgi:hypothetical protein